MAHLNAVVLGENRKVIDQEVDAEFFENFDGELDIESLIIGEVEFSSVLSNPNTIKQYIDQIEEGSELDHPVEVYLACVKRYYSSKNTDFDSVREQVENLFQESIDKAPFVDPMKDFAVAKAIDFLETFNVPQVNKAQFRLLEEFFDYDAYQTALFINEFDAVELDETIYFFAKG